MRFFVFKPFQNLLFIRNRFLKAQIKIVIKNKLLDLYKNEKYGI